MEDLFNIGGEEYFFDLDKISNFIKLEKNDDILTDIFESSDDVSVDDVIKETEQVEEMSMDSYQMIDVTKWELTKAMIETVLSENNEVDESMGRVNLEKQLSIPFRISFNTLLINKIIKKNN